MFATFSRQVVTGRINHMKLVICIITCLLLQLEVQLSVKCNLIQLSFPTWTSVDV